MQKRFIGVAIAGAFVMGGGAAIAVPALAADPTPAPSQSAAPNDDQAQERAQSRTDAIKKALEGLVSDKTLTQAQADKVAETLSKPGAIGGGFGHRGGPGGGPGGPGGLGGAFGALSDDGFAAASTVLGLSADDIRSALRDGSTLADLAEKQGKSQDDLVNALVDVAKKHLAQAVKDGKLTQAQSDEITTKLPDRVKDLVANGVKHGPGGMRGERGGPGGAERGGAPAPSAPAPDAPGDGGSSPSTAPSAPAPSQTSGSSTGFQPFASSGSASSI